MLWSLIGDRKIPSIFTYHRRKTRRVQQRQLGATQKVTSRIQAARSFVEREANGGTVKVKARLVMTYYVCTRRAVNHTPLNASSRPRESTVIPRLSRTSFAPSGGDVVECTVDGGRVTLSSRCAPARDDGLRIGAARNGQCAKHEITLRRMDMGWSRLEAGRDARDFLNRFTFPLSLYYKSTKVTSCVVLRSLSVFGNKEAVERRARSWCFAKAGHVAAATAMAVLC